MTPLNLFLMISATIFISIVAYYKQQIYEKTLKWVNENLDKTSNSKIYKELNLKNFKIIIKKEYFEKEHVMNSFGKVLGLCVSLMVCSTLIGTVSDIISLEINNNSTNNNIIDLNKTQSNYFSDALNFINGLLPIIGIIGISGIFGNYIRIKRR